MGSSNPDDATVLFLFISFAVLIILALILVIVSCQTWMLWKMAHAIVEQDSRVAVAQSSKRRSVRSSVYGGGEGESLMRAVTVIGMEEGGKKKRLWGLGRWA